MSSFFFLVSLCTHRSLSWIFHLSLLSRVRQASPNNVCICVCVCLSVCLSVGFDVCTCATLLRTARVVKSSVVRHCAFAAAWDVNNHPEGAEMRNHAQSTRFSFLILYFVALFFYCSRASSEIS